MIALFQYVHCTSLPAQNDAQIGYCGIGSTEHRFLNGLGAFAFLASHCNDCLLSAIACLLGTVLTNVIDHYIRAADRVQPYCCPFSVFACLHTLCGSSW